MNLKVILGLIFVLIGVAASFLLSDYLKRADDETSLSAAGQFVEALFATEASPDDAYAFVSDGYKVMETKAMTKKILETTLQITGAYQGHDTGADVTEIVQPGSGRSVRLFRFPVHFDKDPDGMMFVTLVKEHGHWKVHGFNISSPKILEAQSQSVLNETLVP